MTSEQEGNIVDLVSQKYKDKTWSIQIRVDPCALAELAMYFDRLDGTVRTKSMLGAVIVETLRMVLRDNEMLGETITDVVRAMEVFNELGYALQADGKYARLRIAKTLAVREGFIKRMDSPPPSEAWAARDELDKEMDEIVTDQLAQQQATIDKQQIEEYKQGFSDMHEVKGGILNGQEAEEEGPE